MNALSLHIHGQGAPSFRVWRAPGLPCGARLQGSSNWVAPGKERWARDMPGSLFKTMLCVKPFPPSSLQECKWLQLYSLSPKASPCGLMVQ